MLGAIYLTPICFIYGVLYTLWKRTTDDILDQAHAYKVINIDCAGIHSTANPSLESLFSESTNSITFHKLLDTLEYASAAPTVLGVSLLMDSATAFGYAESQSSITHWRADSCAEGEVARAASPCEYLSITPMRFTAPHSTPPWPSH